MPSWTPFTARRPPPPYACRLGELALAAASFRQVPADEPRIYDYAVFQASKIYKALERYDQLRSHLQDYVDRPDANERPRVSEALYWIGWSLQQEDRSAEAFPLYEDALTRFGDDPKARAVSEILSAYADLIKRSEHATLSFETWLQESSEQSLAENKMTWFARLTRFTAHRQRRLIDNATAEATLLSIHRLVPIREQDPETLAEVGIVLVDRGYESADDYFEQDLNQYPKRFERAAAYYGKAKLAAKKERLDEARRWLIRFLEETPTHPLAAEARLLAADILTRQGVYTAARNALNEILEIKEMRGRPHARALAGLARIETEQDHAKRAIPYWQRIYTLYRAYTELVVEAYWESARLFEEIDDPIAARNTLAKLSVSHEKAENLFIENLEAEENSVSQWVTYLNVVASVAPMIGLLGTVSGMISAFQTIGRGGMGRPELLAGDIGEALITTATGLVIGIPAMIAYFVLKNRLNTAMIATAQAGSEVLDAKEEKAYTSSS